MSSIICATRGGQGSLVAQRRAVEIAKETGKRLVFLYVADPATFQDFDETLIPALHEELHWMGNTLLHIAQRRAGAADIEAELVIRHGHLKEEISRFLQESEASLLLLGAPRNTTTNIFGDDAVEQFALFVQEQTNIEVEVVRPETF